MRFLNLYWRTIKDRLLSWPTIAASVILYILLVIGIYPSFAGNPAFKAILESYPKAILSLLAGGGGGLTLLSPEGFFSIEFLQLWGMIIVAGFIMATATAIVAKEVDGHTMDLLLTQPIDRVEYLTARVAADLTMVLGLVVTIMGSAWTGTKLFDFPLKTDGLIAAGVLLFSLYVLMEAFCLLMGVVMERGRAVIVSVAALIASHLLNALADFNKTIEGWRWLSIFHYYQPGEALITGQVPWPVVLLFSSLAVVLFTAAVVIFREKDIPA